MEVDTGAAAICMLQLKLHSKNKLPAGCLKRTAKAIMEIRNSGIA